MKFLFVFVLGLVLAEARMSSDNYAEYQARHGKKYSSAKEAQMRAQIWQKNKAMIDAHNQDFMNGKSTFTMTDNKFADMTKEEKAGLFGNLPVPKKDVQRFVPVLDDRQSIPTSLNLTTSACMPAIKNQNPCGSCWAFAAVNPIEYQNCIKRGKLVLFSEQQLVSCSSAYGNFACRGGNYESAWNYVVAAGLANSTTIPYTSSNGLNGTCTYRSTMAAVKISGWKYIARNETAIAQAVYTSGPVAVTIYANNGFTFYSGGVFYDPTCPNSQYNTNHEVNIVGYGTAACGGNYWIVRNQWGPKWGVNGYILMARGVNQCGLMNWAALPAVL